MVIGARVRVLAGSVIKLITVTGSRAGAVVVTAGNVTVDGACGSEKVQVSERKCGSLLSAQDVPQ